jgi:hypothetical protein
MRTVLYSHYFSKAEKFLVALYVDSTTIMNYSVWVGYPYEVVWMLFYVSVF